MNVKQKLILITFIILCLLTEKVIWYLFPFTGLGGLISWPLAIIITGISSYIIYKYLKKNRPMLINICMVILIYIIDTFLLIKFHPQDYGGSPITQIKQCISAYKNYDNISFNSFSSLNNAERVTYIFKFKNKLPISISNIYISNNGADPIKSRDYEIFNFKKYLKYNKTKLTLTASDDGYFLTEKTKPFFKTKHFFKRKFLESSGIGYVDTSEKFYYDISKDSFELKSGVEREFNRFLKFTKKASW